MNNNINISHIKALKIIHFQGFIMKYIHLYCNTYTRLESAWVGLRGMALLLLSFIKAARDCEIKKSRLMTHPH